jgi:hypothetical protein
VRRPPLQQVSALSRWVRAFSQPAEQFCLWLSAPPSLRSVRVEGRLLVSVPLSLRSVRVQGLLVSVPPSLRSVRVQGRRLVSAPASLRSVRVKRRLLVSAPPTPGAWCRAEVSWVLPRRSEAAKPGAQPCGWRSRRSAATAERLSTRYGSV